MAVGEDEAVGGKNKSGAAAARLARAACRLAARLRQRFADFDEHDRRADSLGGPDNRLRVGVQQIAVAVAWRQNFGSAFRAGIDVVNLS